MFRSLLAVGLCLLTVFAAPATAEQLYVVIAASEKDPTLIVEKAQNLSRVVRNGLIFTVEDCGEQRRIFAFAAALDNSLADARRTRALLTDRIPGAYIKRCNVKNGSLLSLRIPAVDSSIAAVPKDAVNWDDSDRVSSAFPLSHARSMVVLRRYEATPDDPLEGRRDTVVLARSNGERIKLPIDCLSPSRPSKSKGLIAFECSEEPAGDNILHTVIVVNDIGQIAEKIPHCRQPRWIREGMLSCQTETARADGKLYLNPRHIRVEGR